MDDFSLLDFFVAMMWFYLVFAWLFFLFQLIGDIFRSRDLSGLQKGLWVVFLIFLPFIAAITYLIARGDGMHKRHAQETLAQEEALRERLGVKTSPADEITKLAALRDNGTITEAEYQAHKGHLLASS